MSIKQITINTIPYRIVFQGGMRYQATVFSGLIFMFSVSGSRAITLRLLKYALIEPKTR